MKINIIGDRSENAIIQTYRDTKNHNHSLNVMTLNTILANKLKLGMLFDITRNEPRDIFDIWFLLQRKHAHNTSPEGVQPLTLFLYFFTAKKSRFILYRINRRLFLWMWLFYEKIILPARWSTPSRCYSSSLKSGNGRRISSTPRNTRRQTSTKHTWRHPRSARHSSWRGHNWG